MNLPAMLPLLLAVLLSAGVVLAWARLAYWQARAPAGARSAGWRMAALFLLQPDFGKLQGLLYLFVLWFQFVCVRQNG